MNSDTFDDMDLLQLERELQTLTPVAPRQELVQALKARMEPVPRLVQPARIYSFPWRRMIAPAAAAAAAVAVMNLDGPRRSPRPAVVAEKESVVWTPMPMLPQYRALLNEGYVLNENMDFVPPGYNSIFNGQVWRMPADHSAMRVTMPQQESFLMPAGYGTPQMDFRWQ